MPLVSMEQELVFYTDSKKLGVYDTILAKVIDITLVSESEDDARVQYTLRFLVDDAGQRVAEWSGAEMPGVDLDLDMQQWHYAA